MNLVGKIFIVLILVMSLVFMGLVVAVYTTHTNWRTKSTELGEQLTTTKNEVTALKTETSNLTARARHRAEAEGRGGTAKLPNRQRQAAAAGCRAGKERTPGWSRSARERGRDGCRRRRRLPPRRGRTPAAGDRHRSPGSPGILHPARQRDRPDAKMVNEIERPQVATLLRGWPTATSTMVEDTASSGSIPTAFANWLRPRSVQVPFATANWSKSPSAKTTACRRPPARGLPRGQRIEHLPRPRPGHQVRGRQGRPPAYCRASRRAASRGDNVATQLYRPTFYRKPRAPTCTRSAYWPSRWRPSSSVACSCGSIRAPTHPTTGPAARASALKSSPQAPPG